MSIDTLRNELNTGVSNVEVDWFLKGKLPEFSSSEAHPYSQRHPRSDLSTNGNPQASEVASINNSIPITQINNHNPFSNGLSRSKSLSELEHKKKEDKIKKKGFFRSLFGSKTQQNSASRFSSSSSSPVPPTASIEHKYDPNPSTVTGTRTGTKSSPSSAPQILHRSKSLSSRPHELDPKLEQFLLYYKAKGISKLQSDLNLKSPPTSSTSSIPSTITSTINEKIIPQPKVLTDVLGRAIPAHPPSSKLPSAFAKNPQYSQPIVKTHVNQDHPSRLSFLKRQKSITSDNDSITHSSTVSGNDTKPITIPGLENLPNLKRVAFDIPVFFNDPPQQIPSRNPRKGEVEILKDGSIVVHKLSLAEKRKLLTQSGGGVVVGGSGHLKILSNKNKNEEIEQEDVEQENPKQDQQDQDQTTGEKVSPLGEEHSSNTITRQEQQAHNIEVAAAEAAAEARGKAAPNELKRISTNNEEEEDDPLTQAASKINIDKPMIRSNKSTTSMISLAANEHQSEIYPSRSTKVPLDVLYTRCCHLREILPIPATLKQIKKDSYDPISVLQLRNPKPSLVEVLTFSDFISVVPILCVSLDGVSLSSEMFRIILSSLAHKKELEKLTLRNTPLDDEGWKLLCWFLSNNKTLSRLDLTQVPILSTNVQKPAKSSTHNGNGTSITRMECDMNSRSDMNWNLFNAAILSRNGIEEIILNGAQMSNKEFKDLFEMGLSLKTSKIGLAYNQLTLEQCDVLAQTIKFDQLIGIDLGYNDLNGKLKVFSRQFPRMINTNQPQLRFISLNTTNLANQDGEVDEFISNFAIFRELRYIDLSNNSKLFPSLLSALTQHLPLYPNLSRLHLEYDNLSTESIVSISELIPFCKKLSYLSLVGNHLNNVSASSLVSALKISNSLITLDLNHDELTPKFREAIAVYTVRNMHQQLELAGDEENSERQKDLASLQVQLSQLLLSDNDSNAELIENFIKKVQKIRKKIHDSIDELFKLRIQGVLNTEGKEALIRFCFIDSSFEKGLELLSKKSPIQFKLNDEAENTAQDLIAPPMTKQPSTNVKLSSYVEESGHNELFPFGVSDSKHDSKHDVKHQSGIYGGEDELIDNGEFRAADDSHIKEEASILKLGSLINRSSENIVKDIPQEHVHTLLALSGDHLKNALLKTNNISDLVEILDSFKKQGIQLGEIYKKDDQVDFKINAGKLDLETLKNTSSNISRKQIISDDESDSDNEISENSLSDSSSLNSEGEEINHAYDEILDHLEKVRTNT
ncbi:hypothetical protein WICMUC_005930 [Wickerhamomyces mucosus]|uniref:RNI-like protein n=1 Tax=Wickerhamomyces mucosus TaxID=1378264 RepID=A0A9P8P1X0_9ASCO|nr:hypothetical protein WICMUC_005930 [Wickerhamomyces mucosus]